MNNSILQVFKSYHNHFWFTVFLFALLFGIVESASECHIGLKMFSFESGNAICAPMSSQKCIESCEWNTTCSLTSHYKAFYGRRTYVSGMMLTDNSFLLQCCASFATITQMNAKKEPTCVWITLAETVSNKGNIRFDPPLATNEYIRDMLAKRIPNGRVKLKAQICKFITQIFDCEKSDMNSEEFRFYSTLQQRLTKIKNLLHIATGTPEKNGKFFSINTNSQVPIFKSVQISASTTEKTSNSTPIISFNSDSVTINHPDTFQQINFESNTNNYKAAILPRIYIKRLQSNVFDSSIENNAQIMESLKNVSKNLKIPSQKEKYVVWPNDKYPRKKSWSKTILRNSSSISELMPFKKKQFNQIRIPVYKFQNNDQNALYKQIRNSEIIEELAIKNQLQIQKIEHGKNVLPQFAQAPIIAQNVDDFSQNLAPNQYTRFRNPQLNINQNHAFAKAPKFKIIPLVEHKFSNAQTKVIQRPTTTYAQHYQRQYQIQKQQDLKKMQTMRKTWAGAQKLQQNQKKNLNSQNLHQSKLQMQENLKMFHKLKSTVDSDTEKPTSTSSAAALSGLLSCCQQQAPGCKHLCSKDVSQNEIKHALTTNQCAPLSMTTVIQCFPRYYNVSAVTQCCHANATKPTIKIDATTLNNPFKSAAPPVQRLPEQCLSLCAPNFKLSFAHFACIDHISTIVECYRDLIN